MDNAVFFPSLLTMAVVTYLIRMLPLAVCRHRSENRFFQSFLHYVPYAVLGAMTFPAVFTCTGDPVSSLCGLAAGFALGWTGKGLLSVALAACAAAYLASLIF